MIKIAPLVIGMIIALTAYFLINSIFFNKVQIKPDQHPYYQLGIKMCECFSITNLNIKEEVDKQMTDSIGRKIDKMNEDYVKCMNEYVELGESLKLDSLGYSSIENRIIPYSEIKEHFTKGYEANGCDIRTANLE